MSENSGRFYLMIFFFTGTAIMFLLWHGFHEAGLSETAGHAYAFTWVWFLFTALHTSISYRLFDRLEDIIDKRWGTTNAN